MSQIKIEKKISNKLFKDIAIGESVRIAGVLRSFEEGEGSYGTFQRFRGSFAVALPSGEIYKSGILYLPEIGANLLSESLISAVDSAGDSFAGMEFALDLVKSEDEKSATGYRWSIVPVVAPSVSSDAALRLLGNVAPAQTALDLEPGADLFPETAAEDKPAKAKK